MPLFIGINLRIFACTGRFENAEGYVPLFEIRFDVDDSPHGKANEKYDRTLQIG